jgi:spermidine/putrescine transport system substrate-binding protein
MVRQMARLNMLAPMNHARLPHLSDLDPYYTNLSYDPGLLHSVPFTWGTTGLAVNTAKVKVPGDGVSWKLLYESPDPRHTSLLDDMREVFGGIFKMRGLPLNTADPKAIALAKAEISGVKSKILMFTSEPKPLLLREELTVAHVFSTDAIQANAENPQIKYFIPKEGGTVWTDNFAIPVSAKHIEEAHVFIDYFLTPENVMSILLENHLATPNRSARLKLPPAVSSDPNIYPPPEVMKRMEFLEDIGESLQLMSRGWTELKT